MKPLSYKQKDILRTLHQHREGGFLRGHKAANGASVFRLMDAKLNPVTNYKREDINDLIVGGFLTIDGASYRLDLEAIRRGSSRY